MSASLIVLGSANTDYTVVVDRHPLPGETLLGRDLIVATGGKGANQALAAARAGAMPVFVGAVGDDAGGRAMLDALGSGGVDVSSVARLTDAPTGVALITVSRDGENTIVVAPGANGRLDADAVVTTIADLAGPGTVLLSQLEVPLDVVHAAARAVATAGGRLVLNLSPARDVPEDLLALCDPLVVNESEARATGGASATDEAGAEDTAQTLATRCRSVVVTLGGDGAVWSDGSQTGRIHAPAVEVVDTTGAGDAFVGALAAALSDGRPLVDAVETGVAAGSAAVQWLGAQPPRR